MVSVDITKNFIWSTPHFKTKQDEVKHCYNRFEKMVTEDAIPPLPTRQEELAYLDWLEKSIGEDPIITLRPKRYMAGPLRLRWKILTQYRNEYRKTFVKNFLLCTVLFSPLSIFLARRRRYMPFTGVPRYTRKTSFFIPEYPLLSRTISHSTTRAFYVGFVFYSVVFGFAGAYIGTDQEYGRDDLLNRPDYLPLRAMVRDDYIPIEEKKVLELMTGSYFGQPLYKSTHTSIWKRAINYLYPYYDYNADKGYCHPHFDFSKDYQNENWSNHYHL